MPAVQRRLTRARVAAGAGDPTLVEAFAANYRFWAQLPAKVTHVLFLAKSGRTAREQMTAVAARPVFPRGVCTGCGCQEHDACAVPFDSLDGVIGCHWLDATRTRCSACGPVRPSVRKGKK